VLYSLKKVIHRLKTDDAFTKETQELLASFAPPNVE